MRPGRVAGVVVACSLATASVAAARGGEPEQRQPVAAAPSSEEPEQRQASAPDRSADFLFGRPKASIGIRGSWVFAGAGSDIFDFVTRHLTLDKKDFDSPGFAVDVGFALTPRTDIQVGLELNRVSRQSEYRDYVDNLFEPIQQTTTLNATHIVGSVRYALMPKGREVGRLAWI